MTRNLGKDGGGRRAPSERGSCKVRAAFPHICVPLHQQEEINRWQEGRRFCDSRSLSQASLVRWRRQRSPSPIPARPVFRDCRTVARGTARDLYMYVSSELSVYVCVCCRVCRAMNRKYERVIKYRLSAESE